MKNIDGSTVSNFCYTFLYREKNGKRKELDQQKESYASNPEVRERKKKWYENEKKEQKIWEKQQIEKRRMEHAQERLISGEEKAREKFLGL